MSGIEKETFFRLLREQCVLPVNDCQAEQFYRYYGELCRVNAYMNLTAITEPEAVIKKHFCDSLLPLSLPHLTEGRCCVDVGSGAGFPGIPIGIMRPDLQITLLDSLGKRVEFLSMICRELSLENCRAVKSRAEDAKEYRESFDVAFSRGVARLSVLSEYCLPYVKRGGRFISYKSEKVSEEMKDAEYAIHILGGEIEEQIAFYLPDSEFYRNLFVVKKCHETPLKYPRKAGTAAKKPLKR